MILLFQKTNRRRVVKFFVVSLLFCAFVALSLCERMLLLPLLGVDVLLNVSKKMI
jgi:hypothetical protein